MNDQFNMPIQTTPDITIPGASVEKLMMLLNNTTVFVKTSEGIMRPFIDPLPVTQIIMRAIQDSLQERPKPVGPE